MEGLSEGFSFMSAPNGNPHQSLEPRSVSLGLYIILHRRLQSPFHTSTAFSSNPISNSKFFLQQMISSNMTRKLQTPPLAVNCDPSILELHRHDMPSSPSYINTCSGHFGLFGRRAYAVTMAGEPDFRSSLYDWIIAAWPQMPNDGIVRHLCQPCSKAEAHEFLSFTTSYEDQYFLS